MALAIANHEMALQAFPDAFRHDEEEKAEVVSTPPFRGRAARWPRTARSA